MNQVLAVEATGVTKTFGSVRAVDDISIRVAEGEVYGVLGPNGAGKTTFLRMLFGLIRPDAGTIRVLGKSWDEAGVGVLAAAERSSNLGPDDPLSTQAFGPRNAGKAQCP